jgi:hypothetical protein
LDLQSCETGPVVIARDTDYAGFLDEIQRTGVEIE